MRRLTEASVIEVMLMSLARMLRSWARVARSASLALEPAGMAEADTPTNSCETVNDFLMKIALVG